MSYNELVNESNDFEPLRTLPDEVLAEVVREAERRLDAQLQIATAADQRALTFAGFQIAAATGSLAGGVALMAARQPDLVLAAMAFTFALVLLLACLFAMATVWPRKFSIPGNEPANWLPEEWRWPDKGFALEAARVEQASCLQECIEKNRRSAEWASRLMHWSMGVTAAAVATAGIALLLVLTCRT